jgi:dCTP diphosphatase
MDNLTTVSFLRAKVGEFIHQRQWEKFHTPKNLSMSIAIEAAELMEHFQWIDNRESLDLKSIPEVAAEVKDELADILIYCLSFANSFEIDIVSAIDEKMQKNETRFPRTLSQTSKDTE